MTAVEWLATEIDVNILVTEKVKLAIEKAKEMELEKLLEAYKRGFNDAKQSSNEFGSIFKDY
jgi:hypothetical protein